MDEGPNYIIPLIIGVLAIIGMIAFSIVVVKANTEREGRTFDYCLIIPAIPCTQQK